MTRDDVQRWLDRYVDAWRTYDVAAIGGLFAADASYRYHPYDAEAVVYGHLHIPRTTWYDGVRFEEVSVGYPREWQQRGLPDPLLRRILPAPEYTEESLGHYGVHFEVDPKYREDPERFAAERTAAQERLSDRRAAARERIAERRAARAKEGEK